MYDYNLIYSYYFSYLDNFKKIEGYYRSIFYTISFTLTYIIIFILKYLYLVKIKYINIRIDEITTSVSDYSVIIKEIKVGNKKIFEDFLEKENKFKIKKINYIYYINEFVQWFKKINLLKKEIISISLKNKFLSLDFDKNKNDIEFDKNLKRINKLNIKLSNYNEKLNSFKLNIKENDLENINLKFTGDILVTFDTLVEKNSFLKKFGVNKYNFFFKKILRIKTVKFFNNKRFKVKEAPEPLDINFFNFGISKITKFKRKLISYIVSIIILLVDLIIIIWLKNYQRSISFENKNLVIIIDIVIAMVISILNLISEVILKLLTKFQKSVSKTSYLKSYLWKLSIFSILNSVLIIYIVEFYNNGFNLVYDFNFIYEQLFYIMIFNVFFNSLVDIFNIKLIYLIYKRYSINKNNSYKYIPQFELNKIYENPKMNLALNYSRIIKTIVLTVLYSYVVPLSYIFGILYLIITYITNKLLMCYVYSIGNYIDIQINFSLLRLFDFVLILMNLSNLLYKPILKNKSIFILDLILLIISLIDFLFINNKNFLKLFKINNNEIENKGHIKYEDARWKFITEYDRVNPITLNLANKEYLEYLQTKNKEIKNNKSMDSIVLRINKYIDKSLKNDTNTILENIENSILINPINNFINKNFFTLNNRDFNNFKYEPNLLFNNLYKNLNIYFNKEEFELQEKINIKDNIKISNNNKVIDSNSNSR